MSINIDNFSGTDGYDIDLRQKDVSGGKITVEQIDSIKQFPKANSIIISGLEQNTFDYFISEYGNQFKAISFWKNKDVKDLSILSGLEQIEYITYFYNQKATNLWDMSNNKSLKGLELDDFSKLHSVDEIKDAPILEVFKIGNAVWDKMQLDSFKPVALSKIKHFSWYGDKVLDSDYSCLANGRIKTLDISPRYFTLDELAQLIALFPEDLQGTLVKPYYESTVIDDKGKETTFYFLCRGKRKLTKGIDEEKFHKYLDEFYELKKKYGKV